MIKNPASVCQCQTKIVVGYPLVIKRGWKIEMNIPINGYRWRFQWDMRSYLLPPSLSLRPVASWKHPIVPRLKDAPIDCPTMIFKTKNLRFCFKDFHEHHLKPPFLSDFPILFTSISVSGISIGGFHKWGYPKLPVWFLFMENPNRKWMISGYPYDSGNPNIKKNNGAAWFFMFSPFACAMNTAKITAAKRLQSTRNTENVKRLPGWPWMALDGPAGKILE